MRGKNKIASRLRRKQKNVIDEQTQKLKEKLIKEKEANVLANSSGSGDIVPEKALGALRRFY